MVEGDDKDEGGQGLLRSCYGWLWWLEYEKKVRDERMKREFAEFKLRKKEMNSSAGE